MNCQEPMEEDLALSYIHWLFGYTYKIGFLNQACAWFLKIDPMRIVGLCVHVSPSPRLLITTDMMCCDMNLI